jgi:hypothetical protein
MSFSPLEWQIVRFTLAVCAFSTLLILPVGLATAWLLDRYHWPGKLLVETVVTLPLVLPPVATGLVLLKMFGRRGPIGHFLSQHFDIDVVFTWRAVVLAAAVMSFPLLVRSARVGFQGVDQRLEQIARTLGAVTCVSFSQSRFHLLRVASSLESSWRSPVPLANLERRYSWREIFREEQQRFRSKFSPPYNLATMQLPIVFSSYASLSLSPRCG